MNNEEAYEDSYYGNRPFKEVVTNDVLTSEWWFKTYAHALGTARYSFGYTDPRYPTTLRSTLPYPRGNHITRTPVPISPVSIEDPYSIHALITKAETKAALRVAIKDNGLIDIIDFTLPSFKGKLRKNIAQKDAPAWLIRAICTLRIAQEGNYVDGLGLKVSDALYYLEPQEGEEESDDLEQRKESD
jgi:hypothetical protein